MPLDTLSGYRKTYLAARGEGSVTYNYGADQKRRQRTVGGVSAWYNWGIGWDMLNEESGTGSGTLQKTYIGGMAEIAGSSPATGTYSYYATDNLGSPRAVYNQAKALVAELDYTPYGQAYTANDTIGITHRYTGHDWDATAALYFAPYRFYNPQLARWMSRDPLGMVDGPNVYAYVVANPVRFIDPLGLDLLDRILIGGGYVGCVSACVSGGALAGIVIGPAVLLSLIGCLISLPFGWDAKMCIDSVLTDAGKINRCVWNAVVECLEGCEIMLDDPLYQR